ncbi:hypothetical protein CLV62_1545 [Dysgonomonas alginatilytica]|uniref:Uncharacterized protein n=1 Tax=Dysgonomonas alginatilytica TaxID=1605892 RepID=A0A2V3PHE9_9BACT|nr:hypothetical protein [Dysgonomonas alginatilytica]PXV57155.1 hypothetical protein CLV62_1545 [Dysgonomonas alginatilytica]
METKKTLPELVEGALNELYRLQYSSLSINQYKQKFSQLMKFVKDSGTEDIYSEELAAKFLKEIYGYLSEKYKEVLPTKIRAALRSFWLLGEYQLYGRFHRKFGKKGEGILMIV